MVQGGVLPPPMEGTSAQFEIAEGGPGRPEGCRLSMCYRTIEIINRMKLVVARASGTDLASSLKQNTFLILEVRPAGGSARERGNSCRHALSSGKRVFSLKTNDFIHPPFFFKFA